MKFLSWNILHGGGSRVEDIVEAIGGHSPDVVCLQEFRHGKSRQPIIDGLKRFGLSHVHAPETNGAAINSVAIFSRIPVTTLDHYRDKKNAVRCCEARLEGDTHRVLCVGFPHKKEQLPLFEHLLTLDKRYTEDKSIIIGDFNCGIPFEDSETRTFPATHLFQQLQKQNWIDSWRTRNPERREFTWYSTQKGNGFRYDHALVSEPFNRTISDVYYDHLAREQRVSDHSALIVETSD